MRETEKRIQMYQARLPLMKERVLAALLLFAFAIAMVTMTTFAWTTLSVAPEVSGATTTITANGNLEIALAGSYDIKYAMDDKGEIIKDSEGNPIIEEIIATPPLGSAVGDSLLSIQARNQTWGNLINLSDPSYGLDKIVLRPTMLNMGYLAKKPFVSATYGPDGRVENDKNSNFGYTKYLEIGEGTGVYGFLKSDIPGVKAVSSILAKPTHIDSKLGLFYTEMLNDTIPITLLGGARNKLTEIVQQMDLKYVSYSPLSGLMATYLNGLLYKTLTENEPSNWTAPEGWTKYDPIACDRNDMQSLCDLMERLDAEVMDVAGEAFVELFYLYQMDTYVDREAYDALKDPEKEFVWPTDWVRFAEDSQGYVTAEGLADFCTRAPALIDAMNAKRAADNQIPSSFKTTISQFKAARAKLQTAINNLQAELGEGDEIYWYEVATDVNNLVNIESTKVNGKKLSEWFASLSSNLGGLLGILNGNYNDNNAVVTAGAVCDIDALLYSGKGIWIERITVSVEAAAIKNRTDMDLGAKTIKANVKTDVVEKNTDALGNLKPSASSQALVDATGTLDTGYVVYNYQALDTYGLAIDFWVRTNVPSASLRLEGEVKFKDVPVTKKVVIGDSEVEVDIYLATIIRTVNETGKEPSTEELTVEVYKQTVDGSTVWYYANSGAEVVTTETIYGGEDGQTEMGTIKTEVSGAPTQKIDKIPDGYSAGNRIWNEGELPFGYEAKYSTSQGSGSCYTFYADPTELNTILDVLELMRVAFVDAEGNLLAIAKLDTQYCFSEYGRHLVPLVLYSDYDEKTVTDQTGKTTTYRTIMDLNTNEPTFISALVYLEGNSIENKDVLSSADIKGQFNIQFATTYDENALKDEELMNEKIIVSAELADKSQTGTTYVKTVTATIAGTEAHSVKANFTRRISSTQGSVYFKEDLAFTEIGNGQWACDFTFVTPGTYILRSITVDGQERMLENPLTFTIDGFKIEELQSNLGSNYTYMSAGSYFTDTFTLSIKAGAGYEMPKTIKGIFTNEDNVNVDLNFKKTNTTADSSDWTANVTFNASGTYTLRYLLIDGEYYEVNPFIREIVLGLKTRVWLTAPGADDFMESEEYGYDRINDVYMYFYMGKEHKFDAKLEIYDESGKEIKQLGGTTGVDLVYGNVTAKLKWNPTTDSYSGAALTLNAPGSYAFTSVIIPMENGNQTVTASIGAPRVVVATKDPYSYQETRVPTTEFNAILTPNPSAEQYPRVDLFFEYASSAAMFGKFKVIDANGNESTVILKAEYKEVDETNGYFSFKIPTDEYGKFSDGFYQLVEVKFTNVTKVKGGKFYQSNEDLTKKNEDGTLVFDNPTDADEFLTMTFGDESALADELVETYEALNPIKIIATLKIKVEDGSPQYNFSGAFLEKHTLFGEDGMLTVSVKDFNGDAIIGLGDLSLTIDHDRTTMTYSVSDNDYNTINPDFTVLLKDENGDGVYTSDVLPQIYLVGDYTVTLQTANKVEAYDDIIQLSLKNIKVTSTLPTVTISSISPNGQHKTWNDDGELTRTSQIDGNTVTIYCEGKKSGSNSISVVTYPRVTLKIANMGNAEEAVMTFAPKTSYMYEEERSKQTDSYVWEPNQVECTRYFGNYASGTCGGSAKKDGAGTVAANQIVLEFEGVMYTVTLDYTITINNPTL